MQNIVKALADTYGTQISRKQFAEYVEKTGDQSAWAVYRKAPDAGRGLRDLSSLLNGTPVAPKVRTPKAAAPKVAVDEPLPPVAPAAPLVAVSEDDAPSLSFSVPKSGTKADILANIQALVNEASALARVPEKSSAFVPFGDYDVVKQIITSRVFHPIFITGLSGNGKTFQVEQACAALNREYIRVNVTAETDEDDLIGGFRLKNGETVFELGPVVVAMLRGAVLLIDEIDLASPKILCLQSILEGNSLVIKKLGITIRPAAGFTVFATANTKGRGSDDGKFVGTNLLNEAFLERFPITIEQAYPSVATEKKILAKTFAQYGGVETAESIQFFDSLAKWADGIRATYLEAEAIDDLISTRRLVHIVKTYRIFGDQQRAVALCLNRFDKATQATFLDLFSKVNPETAAAAPVVEDAYANDIQF